MSKCTFGKEEVNYLGHVISKEGVKVDVTVDFTTHGRSHIYGLLCPSANSLDPMDLYYPLMFQDNPLKTLACGCTRLLTSYSRVHMNFDLKPAYIGMCA